MVDKQIIIDGVDVSGCSLYEDNPKYRMWGTCDCMRTMIDQSGYDELAGAECKGYNCYYKQLKRKEQECERLKKENNQFDNGINEQFSKIIELEGRNNLLKQTLTEIKEIVESCGWNFGSEILYKRIEHILQKCNEVIENE